MRKITSLTRTQFVVASLLQGKPLTRAEILARLKRSGKSCSTSALHQLLRRLKKHALLDELRSERDDKGQPIHWFRYVLNKKGMDAVAATFVGYAVDSGLSARELKKLIVDASRV